MFAPSRQEIYPRQSTVIHVAEITDKWEGKSRPGHFDGVATVVAKLFNIVRPRAAYFGWKDLQQCLVIKRMVEDLDMPVSLSFRDTVRERDGLAMSSRNAYLDSEHRKRAPLLYETLRGLATRFRQAEFSGVSIDRELSASAARLAREGFSVDYLDFVDLEGMGPLRKEGKGAIIVAARIGDTRLIDNLQIDPA
jgi:pantoate--beta-alanine ligase